LEEAHDESTAAAAMEEGVRLLPWRITVRDGREEKLRGGAGWWSDVAREGGKVGRVALPMAAVSLSQYAVQVASNMMVGHLPGVLPLAASAIATSLATVSGFSLLVSVTLPPFDRCPFTLVTWPRPQEHLASFFLFRNWHLEVQIPSRSALYLLDGKELNLFKRANNSS
jgi:hypothetical protein